MALQQSHGIAGLLSLVALTLPDPPNHQRGRSRVARGAKKLLKQVALDLGFLRKNINIYSDQMQLLAQAQAGTNFFPSRGPTDLLLTGSCCFFEQV